MRKVTNLCIYQEKIAPFNPRSRFQTYLKIETKLYFQRRKKRFEKLDKEISLEITLKRHIQRELKQEITLLALANKKLTDINLIPFNSNFKAA